MPEKELDSLGCSKYNKFKHKFVYEEVNSMGCGASGGKYLAKAAGAFLA